MDQMDFYFVAFLDILGFSDMVDFDCKSPTGGQFLEKLYKVHNNIRDFLPDDTFSVIQFSDTVVFSKKFNKNAFVDFLKIISEYQKDLLKEELLCRGGISFGKHFCKDDFIFSEVLIKAYFLERDMAIYPRVVISSDLLDLIYPSSLPPEPLIIKEIDNVAFVHYLRTSNEEEKTFLIKKVKKLFGKNYNNPKIRDKYVWLAQYADFVFETNIAPSKFKKFWKETV